VLAIAHALEVSEPCRKREWTGASRGVSGKAVTCSPLHEDHAADSYLAI
jgi:hypothetical protein